MDIASLFQRHGPAVYRRARRILGNHADAEEALQEIFIRVMNGGFRGEAQITTWLYQVTTNYCLNQLRNRKRRDELQAIHIKEDDVAPDAPDLQLVRRLLSDADPQQALAATYVYLDGMSHQEASEVMGVARRTVGNLLERFDEWAKLQPGVSAQDHGVAGQKGS